MSSDLAPPPAAPAAGTSWWTASATGSPTTGSRPTAPARGAAATSPASGTRPDHRRRRASGDNYITIGRINTWYNSSCWGTYLANCYIRCCSRGCTANCIVSKYITYCLSSCTCISKRIRVCLYCWCWRSCWYGYLYSCRVRVVAHTAGRHLDGHRQACGARLAHAAPPGRAASRAHDRAHPADCAHARGPRERCG